MADRTVVYRLQAEITQFKAQMAAAGASVKDAADKMTASTKEGEKFRRGLSTLGGTAGKVGLVAAAGLGAAVAAAANFDKSMSAVQAATHETSGNMELLRKAAIKAGADTVYSASEAAGAIEELAKAGVSTKDILAGGLSGSLNLAAAGAIDVGDAAELAATAMTQFKLGGDQVNHVADLLAAGAGKAQGSVSDLGMALKQGGLVASQTGLSVEETVGTLSAFASAGLIGSDAGTSFKTMLQALTPSSKAAKDQMEALGISAYDAQGNFVGMANFAGQLRESLSKMSVEQQNAALKTIFGSDAVRAASVIYQQGAEGIQGWIDKTNDAGYAAETAATRLDNLSGDLEQLKGSLETALIGAGEGSQGPLRKLVQGLTDVVNAFNKLPAGAQSSTTALLGITAVFGGGLWFTSKVVNGVTEMRAALENLGVSGPKAERALSAVGKAAKLAGGVTAVGVAVGMMADGINRINPENLERSMTALGRGEITDDLSKVIDSLEEINATRNKVDLGEIVTLGGLFGDTSLDKFANNIDQVDQALAGLVESGQQARAAEVFQKISDLAEAKGVSPEKTAKAFDAYALALRNAAGESKTSASATDDFGTAAQRAKSRVQALNAAVAESRKAARETASSFVNLGDSLNKSKVSLGQWIADMRKQADALRNFRLNAEKAANKGLRQGLIAALQEAGPEGALRMRQLANATDSEIHRANQAWLAGQREIGKYTNAVGDVPKSVSTKLSVDTGGAFNQISALKFALDQLHDKTVTIDTVRTTSNLGKLAGIPVPGSADGGTVTGAPRRPYGDKVLYALAPGEEVISNRHGQADRNRGLLKAINAGRLADGGTAGGSRAFAAPSLAGLKIEGRLEVNDRGESYLRGVIREEIEGDRHFQHVRTGGGRG